ncbi:hypothetical protein GCM10010156_37350 [Planobispora rosea]|uniref:Uncharacterized protein n=1 Tax=Planobispora rosea TaxID=35762 RepID=A0A8J3RUW1_PLARO|nr:hypothetical protein GCM10010156_37350 [Planobispora rosea]GIH81810.1 hypothetical protein Pro02_02180 [Planobispora rosea]
MREHRLDQGRAVADRGHDVVTVLLEQPDQAFTQQDGVIGQDDPERAARR